MIVADINDTMYLRKNVRGQENREIKEMEDER